MQILLQILFLCATMIAQGAPKTLNYQGRIVKADGHALEYSAVAFEFRITNPTGNCIIYREQKNGLDMTNSNGLFDTPIGAGTKLFPQDPLFSLVDSFDNSATLNCEGGATYTPLSDDGRLLRVQFHDGQGWKAITPDNVIRSVPFASYASKSASTDSISNKTINDLVLKSSIPTCATGYVLTSSGSGTLSCVADAAGSSGTVTTISGSSSISAVDNGSGSYTISAIVGTTSGTVAAGNDSRIVNSLQSGATAGGDLTGTYPNPTIAKIQNTNLTITTLTTGQYLKYNGTSWVNASISTSDVSGMGSYLTQSAFNSAVAPAASCSTTQSMYWNSVAGNFDCQNITLPTAVSGNLWSGDGTNVYRGSGNVSIGTSTADTTLTVLSNAPSTATHPNRAGLIVKSEGTNVGGRIGIRTSSSSENPTIIGYRSLGTLATPTAITTSNHLLNISGMGFDGAAWKEGASVLFSPGEPWDTTKTGANIIFKTATNGTNSATEKVRIAHNGKIGIGVTSPNALLDAETTSSGNVFTGRFAANPGATGPGNFNALILDNTFGATNYKNEIKFRSVGNDKFSIGTDPAGAGEQIFYIWDAVASARRMNIDSSGNVGIGIDVPTQKLDVAGKVKATEFCIGTSCVTAWPSGAGAGTWDEGSGHVYRNTGNVGIGTTSPTHKLNIVGGSGSTETTLLELRSAAGNANTGTNINLINSSVAGGFAGSSQLRAIRQADNSGDFALNTANTSSSATEVLRIKGATGNVGIGTNAPSAKLDVAGEVKFGNTASACNSTNEGQQRYNSTSKTMEFCNGTSWSAIGAASGVSAQTTATSTCTSTYSAPRCSTSVAQCPAGYQRSGCSAAGDDAYVYTNSGPSGTNGCVCAGGTTYNDGANRTITCVAYCVK